ncbi:MAG: hypothetical protein UX27_C0029G0013 [Candidatus Azambacteria bacterium GW2011_GWA2_45_90]|uniref:Uncharacterized protein n=1 Tax=Candidatus Azambacteria bacterium GW2011_GWA2_45_90 TaxID=1618614 RepID=A0A0G1NAV6_9BACT|nr:MAG: hypothetical protein UX27_C0029G0013 [Candidatus Azambacteria bacterium GW2011_GWA2_45_90]
MKIIDKKWKWAVAIILLLLAGYFLYSYFFYTCCAPPPKSAPVISDEQDSDQILDDPDLLYAKRAFIGLCRTRSGDGGSCRFNTYLYKSGKLIKESDELVMAPDGEKTTTYPTIRKELDKNAMTSITKQIQDSGVMKKTCEAEMVTDYYVHYFINLDGIKKEFQFPGCEAEIKEVDTLIDAAADK